MKNSTPLSIGLAALLALALYATPWAMMWLLDLAPPEFGIDTVPASDGEFVAIAYDDYGIDEAVVEDVEDFEEPVDAPVDDDPVPEDPPETEGKGTGPAEVAGDGEAAEDAPPGKGLPATGGATAPPKKVAPRRRRRGRPAKCRTPHPHVRKGADGVVEIDRSFVRAMTKNLKTFMSLGYSRPYRNGDTKGWFISGFGCTSPVFKAGFRRSDVLLTVNGKKTRTVTGVFMLYLKLKNKSDFEVRLLRRGQERTLKFRVVPS